MEVLWAGFVPVTVRTRVPLSPKKMPECVALISRSSRAMLSRFRRNVPNMPTSTYVSSGGSDTFMHPSKNINTIQGPV
jgi:hypothetical protein